MITEYSNENKEIVTHHNNKAGIEIMGFDFGTDRQVAVKLVLLGDRGLRQLKCKVHDSANVPDEQRKSESSKSLPMVSKVRLPISV